MVGVGIDFDHFLVARLNTGSWASLRRALAHPATMVFDQAAIFAEDDLWAIQRLLSHVVIAGAAVAVLVAVSPYLAAFTALVCYVHVLADLLRDNGLA